MLSCHIGKLTLTQNSHVELKTWEKNDNFSVRSATSHLAHVVNLGPSPHEETGTGHADWTVSYFTFWYFYISTFFSCPVLLLWFLMLFLFCFTLFNSLFLLSWLISNCQSQRSSALLSCMYLAQLLLKMYLSFLKNVNCRATTWEAHDPEFNQFYHQKKRRQILMFWYSEMTLVTMHCGVG
jgi:hypothetical protein